MSLEQTRIVADHSTAIENLLFIGRVVSIDPTSARAVVTDGDLTTPLLPVAQVRAGAQRSWWMPSEGEQVLVACPGGKIERGIVLASLYAKNAPSNDPQTPMLHLAGGTLVIDGNLQVTGNLSIGGAVDVAQTVTSGGDQIADGISQVKHVHSEVVRGGEDTGKPKK